MIEQLRSHRLQAMAMGAVLAIGVNSAAEAQTGGTAVPEQIPVAPPVQVDTQPGSPCPSPEQLTSRIAPDCNTFLLKTLRNGSVYDDISPLLRVATYQKVANLDVDGVLGPKTAKSILTGKSLKVASPDPKSRGRELLVDKSDQVAYSLLNGKLQHIISVSTGTEAQYEPPSASSDGKADTEPGTYKIYNEMAANYKNSRGQAMPFAHYFQASDGLAAHSGFVDVNGRDSHGCVRIDGQTMVRYIVRQFKRGDKVKIQE